MISMSLLCIAVLCSMLTSVREKAAQTPCAESLSPCATTQKYNCTLCNNRKIVFGIFRIRRNVGVEKGAGSRPSFCSSRAHDSSNFGYGLDHHDPVRCNGWVHTIIGSGSRWYFVCSLSVHGNSALFLF